MTVVEAVPEPPSRVEMDESIRLITDNSPRIMTWNYERDRDQLVTLYNKAMASQWNSVTDLDWKTDVDPEKLVPNTRKLGLLDANNGYLCKKWEEAGLMEFEFADDTASDYETYDAVAQDRAAATAG
jgi:hypothetical protein